MIGIRYINDIINIHRPIVFMRERERDQMDGQTDGRTEIHVHIQMTYVSQHFYFENSFE